MLISRGHLRDDWRYGREMTGNEEQCLYMSLMRWKDVLSAEEMAREIWKSDLPFLWSFHSDRKYVETSPLYPLVRKFNGIKDVVELGVLPIVSNTLGAIIMYVPGNIT